MRFLSNFGCKIILICSFNFWHQKGSNPLFKGSLFLEGVCRPVLEILILFQTKKCHFPHPSSVLASKIHYSF